MAVLTWRNVEAPDFRPSLEGYESFSRLLGNAFGGLQRGLDRYDRSISDQVNTAFQLRLAQAKDAEAAQGIIDGLATDPNARRVSADTLSLALARPNALITQALNQENLDWTKYGHDRTRGFDAAEDRVAGIVADRTAAYAAGNGEQWDRDNPDALRGLSLAATRQLVQDGPEARLGNLRITGAQISNDGGLIQNDQARLGLDRGRWDFQNAQVDRNEQRAASDFVGNFLARGHGIEDLDGALASSGLSGSAQMLVRSQLGAGGISGGPGGLGGPGGGQGGVPGQRVMGWTPRGVDGNSDASVDNKIALISRRVGQGPDVALTQDQFLSLDMTALEGRPAGRNNFGNMRAADGSWQQFNSKDDYLRAQRAWLQRRWNEGARTVRDAVEGRVVGGDTVSNMIGQVIGGQAGRAQYQQTNSASGVVTDVQSAMTDIRPLTQVISGLTSDGPLKGASVQWVGNQISAIKARAARGPNGVRLTDAAAAAILTRSLAPNNSWLPNVLSGSANNSWTIDSRALENNISQVINPRNQTDVLVANAGIGARSAAVDQARSSWDAARARLEQARARAARNPSFDPQILRQLENEEVTASRALQSAIAAQVVAARNSGAVPAQRPPAPRSPPLPPPPARVTTGRPVGGAPVTVRRARGESDESYQRRVDAARRQASPPPAPAPRANQDPGWFARQAWPGGYDPTRGPVLPGSPPVDPLLQYYLGGRQGSLPPPVRR